MIAWISLVAGAAEPAEPPERHVSVVVRGLVERWNDPSIAAVYKSGAWLGGLGIVAPVWGPVGIDLELAFSRLAGENDTSFEIVPLSMMVEVSAPLGAASGFVGLGPTLTLFTERPLQSGGVDGVRFAGELRGGVRVDTGLVDPPMAPAKGGPVQRLDVELYVGRRAQLPGGPDGFALGAWRGSLGLGLVF